MGGGRGKGASSASTRRLRRGQVFWFHPSRWVEGTLQLADEPSGPAAQFELCVPRLHRGPPKSMDELRQKVPTTCWVTTGLDSEQGTPGALFTHIGQRALGRCLLSVGVVDWLIFLQPLSPPPALTTPTSARTPTLSPTIPSEERRDEARPLDSASSSAYTS